MEKQFPPCHKKDAKPCCEDQTVMHEAQDFKASTNTVSLTQSITYVIYQPWIIVRDLIPSVTTIVNTVKDYDPPATIIDRTIDLQVFLI